MECPPIEALIELGFLVRTKVYAPSTPDLTGVTVKRGDYDEGQLAERINEPKLVGDIVEHWLRLGEGRKTVVFATSCLTSAPTEQIEGFSLTTTKGATGSARAKGVSEESEPVSV